MSQATRAIALQEAVKCFTKDGNAEDVEQVLGYASKFEAWMNEEVAGDGSANPAGEAPATPAKRGRPAKAATTPPSEPEAPAPDDLKQQVGETLSKAIKAGREEAVAVLAKYGAQSLSTIKPKDYAKVLKDLTALLPDPALS